MNTHASLVCVKCGHRFPLAAAPLTCPDHNRYYGYLSITYDYDTVFDFADDPIHSWGKYAPLLPISQFNTHFYEQKTPLIYAKKFGSRAGIKNLWIKDEGKNPTGSFKDKESIIAINVAQEFGLNDLIVVSSGNAAVSTAAYAQKAGFSCVCLVPKHLSVGKRFLLSLYGAKVDYRSGSYEELYRQAIDQGLRWNVTPGYNPYKDEGIKIIGFEIWEEIGVPDIIVAPCGNGTLLFGLFKAFWELTKIGKTSTLPTFVGVQVRGAAPLATAWKKKKDIEVLTKAPESIAEGIVATESFASPKVMSALQVAGGSIVEVTEAEIKDAMKEIIALESLIPEPTAAAVYAGVKKLTNVSNKTVVAIQTASGAKNLKDIMETFLQVR